MKVNNSNVKLAFRKIANDEIRVVMLQLKHQNSDNVVLQTPAIDTRSYYNSTGYEFAHHNDLTAGTFVSNSVKIYDIDVTFTVPTISNITILSSGNITNATSTLLRIATPSVTPSILFCLFKTTDITIDELFATNTINKYLCCNCKRSTELTTTAQYFQVSSNDIQKIDDYTALIVGYMNDYNIISLPTFIAYEVNDTEAIYKNVKIFDSGIITQNSQTT